MDKAIQLILICISVTSWAQCPTDVIDIDDSDTCTMVVMSPEKFTHYYEVEKKFNVIKDTIPSLVKVIERQQKTQDAVIENFNEQVQTAEEQKTLLLETRESCEIALAKVEIENTYLHDKLNVKKKQTKWIVVVSTVLIILSLWN